MGLDLLNCAVNWAHGDQHWEPGTRALPHPAFAEHYRREAERRLLPKVKTRVQLVREAYAAAAAAARVTVARRGTPRPAKQAAATTQPPSTTGADVGTISRQSMTTARVTSAKNTPVKKAAAKQTTLKKTTIAKKTTMKKKTMARKGPATYNTSATRQYAIASALKTDDVVIGRRRSDRLRGDRVDYSQYY